MAAMSKMYLTPNCSADTKHNPINKITITAHPSHCSNYSCNTEIRKVNLNKVTKLSLNSSLSTTKVSRALKTKTLIPPSVHFLVFNSCEKTTIILKLWLWEYKMWKWAQACVLWLRFRTFRISWQKEWYAFNLFSKKCSRTHFLTNAWHL
jgi:hypothetical protein